MGLSNFPSASEGVLPVLVINTVLSVAVLKNIFRSMLQLLGAVPTTSSYIEQQELELELESNDDDEGSSRERRVSITQYKSLCQERSNNNMGRTSSNGWKGVTMVECCVCLCRFEANQEVSELPCKHFFHTTCLDKWFHNKHFTCPLCRSMD